MRNGLETSASSNYCCQKVGSTKQISEGHHMTIVKAIISCVEMPPVGPIPPLLFTYLIVWL